MLSIHEGAHKGCPNGKMADWKEKSSALCLAWNPSELVDAPCRGQRSCQN